MILAPSRLLHGEEAVQPSLSEYLGAIAVGTPADRISSNAVERAKVSLVHNLIVALAGREREPVAHRLAAEHYALPAQATILHSGLKASTEGAAFANGALFHARSQDDTHPDSTSHPGAPVMAAAFAVAEECKSTGAEFIHAVIIGYEVLCRLGRDFDQQVSGKGFRAAAVYGVFGAAGAAARLMGLNEKQAAHALGLASHLSGGLLQVWQEGSAESPLQLGFGARNGIVAARAAAAGATAARLAFEGSRGFYNAYAGTTARADEALADHGLWQIEQVTVKPYPACAILQGPLQLLTAILDGEGFAGDCVEDVALELSPYEARYTGIDNPGPFGSPIAAKMSAQFCLGNTLARRRLALSDLSRLEDRETLSQAAKISVVQNAEIPERLSRITIRTVDGRRVSRMLEEPVGRPSLRDVGVFAAGLSEEIGASRQQVASLLDLVGSLETHDDIAALVSMAAGIGRGG